MQDNPKTIEILLGTYNGEKYLAELLQSLIEQSYSDFKILVRDDGSSDNTKQILAEFAEKFPNKMKIIETQQNLGVIANFSELMKQSSADYILFADQDDWWLPNKVASSIAALKKLEKLYGAETPLLAHSDLIVVDENLQVLNRSFCKFVKINPHYTQLNRLLMQNCVTGCTMVMNRALVNQSLPIPENAMMHDWWIALVASCFGHISYIPEETILYRQHFANVLGAMRPSYIKTFRSFFNKKPVFTTKNQALSLLDAYAQNLSLSNKKMIQDFCTLKERSFLKQRLTILKNGFFKHRKFHNFVKFFFLKFRY